VAANRRSSHLDRIELAGDEFHARVVAAYRTMATAEPDRWLVVDGTGTVEEVAERIATGVADRLSPS
jgi:dTMP kinase